MKSLFFSSIWADDVVRELKVLVDNSFSAQEISRALTRQFGGSFSRNMVISKCFRLGIRLKGTNNRDPNKAPARAPKPPSRPPKPKAPRFETPPGYRRDVEYVAEPTPIGDTPDGCRWMHGDDVRERLFCGADIHGLNYCQHHYARATREPPPRRGRDDRKLTSWTPKP